MAARRHRDDRGVAFADDAGRDGRRRVSDSGNGTTVIHFTAFDVCKGERIIKTGRNASIQDKETCRVGQNSLIPVGKHDIFEPGIDGWFSDYDFVFTPLDDPVCDQPISTDVGACFNLATSGTLTVTKNAHGDYTWHVVTFYAP